MITTLESTATRWPHPGRPPAPPGPERPVVFVVADDVRDRGFLERILDASYRVAWCATTVELLESARPGVPSCVLLFTSLTGAHGLALQRSVAERLSLPVIIIARDADVAATVQAVKAGAVDVLTTPPRTDELGRAIHSALALSREVIAREAALQPLRSRYKTLTPREREVMELVVKGLLNKQVGADLGISEITVKAHRGQVMRKMQADSLPDLVRMAGRLDGTTAPASRLMM